MLEAADVGRCEARQLSGIVEPRQAEYGGDDGKSGICEEGAGVTNVENPLRVVVR